MWPKALYFFLACLSVVTLGLGVMWLALSFILITLLCIVLNSDWNVMVKFRRSKIFYYSFWGLSAYFFSLWLKLFVLEFYYTPSDSMESEIKKGDWLLVLKLSYGPKIPSSMVDIPLLKLFIGLDKKTQQPERFKAAKRLSGFQGVSRGDILIFEEIENGKALFTKRCVGLPGEKIEIRNGKTIVNNKYVSYPSEKQYYKIWIKDLKSFQDSMDVLGISFSPVFFDEAKKYGEAFFSSKDYGQIKGLISVDSIHLFVMDQFSPASVFPYDANYKWNMDKYGPVLIPKKNMKLKITRSNLALYKYILENFESQYIQEKNGELFGNGLRLAQYKFKRNYYFVLGDNRYNSIDSRFFGFLPEDKIEGKAVGKISGGSEFWGKSIDFF